jgi:hypothetical protein
VSASALSVGAPLVAPVNDSMQEEERCLPIE